ncbi:MAG: hypothetical protein LCH95_03035 [Proteobacteria bacterium]|nr:hypothetical protein [Pseudomonadota bacterium]
MQSLGSGIFEFLALIFAFFGCGFAGTKLCEKSEIVRGGTSLDVIIFLATGVMGALVVGWIWEAP